MAGRFALVLLVVLVTAEEQVIRKYDMEDVKRIDDELRRLGVVLTTAATPEHEVENSPPIVEAPAGDFEGYWTKSQFGRKIAAFEGIRYVQAPVGLRRFSVAEPMQRLTYFRAKKPGSKCLQRDLFVKKSNVEGLEDCLFLNVYVPQKVRRTKTEKLPVIFFVHGGAYVGGFGHLHQSNVLLDKDVVLVTFNYRLGALGFLTTEDEVFPANLGAKDQVAALRWVYENIGAFGGDPELITVVGFSAGAVFAELLMLSPLTRGLVKRAAAISGSSLSSWALAPRGEMRRNVRKAADHFNCPVAPSAELLSCLRNLSAEAIANVDLLFRQWDKTPVMPFKPVVEGNIPGALLPHHPSKLFADGPANDVPYLVSVTSEEGNYYSVDVFLNDTMLREFDTNFLKLAPETMVLNEDHLRRPDRIESLRRAYFNPGPFTKANFSQGTNLYTDVYIFWPALKSLRHHKIGSKSSRFFTYISHEGSRTGVQFPRGYTGRGAGISHGDDLYYLFQLPSLTQPTPSDVLMSMIMTNLYTSFARDGVPSSDLINTKWLPIETNGTDYEYLHIKSPLNITMKRDLLPERRRLLDTLFGPNQTTVST